MIGSPADIFLSARESARTRFWAQGLNRFFVFDLMILPFDLIMVTKQAVFQCFAQKNCEFWDIVPIMVYQKLYRGYQTGTYLQH